MGNLVTERIKIDSHLLLEPRPLDDRVVQLGVGVADLLLAAEQLESGIDKSLVYFYFL